jgi:hypothetical protein
MTDRHALAAALRRIGEESRAAQLLEETRPSEIEVRIHEAEFLLSDDGAAPGDEGFQRVIPAFLRFLDLRGRRRSAAPPASSYARWIHIPRPIPPRP